MHRYTAVAVVVLLVLASSMGWAQMYDTADEDIGAFRVKAGLFDLGDADSEFGFGADYEASNWMVSLDYVELEDTTVQTQGGPVAASADLWGISGAWLQRQDNNPGTYYGAGVGYYDFEASASQQGATVSVDDGSIGFELLGGMSFGDAEMGELPPWFAEFRYLLGTDFTISAGDASASGDLDGWKLMVGRRF